MIQALTTPAPTTLEVMIQTVVSLTIAHRRRTIRVVVAVALTTAQPLLTNTVATVALRIAHRLLTILIASKVPTIARRLLTAPVVHLQDHWMTQTQVAMVIAQAPILRL